MAPQPSSNLEFIDFEDSPREGALEQSSFIKLATFVSVLLHSLLIFFLMGSDPEKALIAERESIEIKLLPSNPNRVSPPLAEDSSTEPLPSQRPLTDLVIGEAEPELIPELQQPVSSPSVEPETLNRFELDTDSLANETQSEQRDLQESNFETLRPTVEAISRTVRDVSRRNETQFYTYRCNPLEEEEGLKICAPSSSRAYESLETSAIYQAFNPSRVSSRFERVSGLVSSQARDLSDRLRGQLPEGVSGYLIEELEAGITHSVNEGNRAVNFMIEMTDKSSAAAQARQVLDNPLLLDLKRAQENPTRGVLLSPP